MGLGPRTDPHCAASGTGTGGNKEKMLPANQFAWNLSSLKTGDAVERAIDMKSERARVERTRSPSPMPLGGAVDQPPQGDAVQDEEAIASLSVSTMMAIKACCMQPRNGNYWVWNMGTRFLYAGAFVLCVGVTFATFVYPEWFDLGVMDWFSYTSWLTVAMSELLFIVIRIVGRMRYLDTNTQYKSTGSNELAESFVNLIPFNAQWQFLTVTCINVLSSALFMFGLLITHMQMMVNPDDPSDVHSVALEYRDTWTVGWTSVYCYVVLSPSLLVFLRAVPWQLLYKFPMRWRTQ